MLNQSEIFNNGAEKVFEKYKLKADNYLEQLSIIIQLDTLKTWIKQIESLFEDDIDELRDDLSHLPCFKLSPIAEIKFKSDDEFYYFREIRKSGYDFSAITESDFQKCLRDDTSITKNLNHQTAITSLFSLKKYFIEKLKLLENELKKIRPKKDNFEFTDTLEKACKGSKEYESIKAWFIQNDLCDPDTFVWKDRKSGYKTVLARHLWDLPIKGYTRELDDIGIQNIALNSFGIKIGISTIQHFKADGTSKIPPFSKD
jgi:hypothetical protein